MKFYVQEEIVSWFNTYADSLYNWAYHKTSSKEIAEDLVQETFLSAIRGFDNFKYDSNPKTWLFSILNNKIIDFYRKKARQLTMMDKKVEYRFMNPTDIFFDADHRWELKKEATLWEEDTHILDNLEFKNTLNTCIENLPEHWKFAISAKYLFNKSSELICQELQVTPSNYWQIVHRAKLMLKKCIDLNWSV